MFKGRIISRSNMNGKVHTFQKDFDDYDTYRAWLDEHPDYAAHAILGDWWNPWSQWNPLLPDFQSHPAIPVHTKHLPEGIDLEKYEKKRLEKRQTEAEKYEKKQSLERTEAYLKDYLEENPDDKDAQSDLETIQKEIKAIA